MAIRDALRDTVHSQTGSKLGKRKINEQKFNSNSDFIKPIVYKLF